MKKSQKSLLLLVAVVFVLTVILLAACANKVTITFVTNGGTEIASIKAKAGEEITPPSDPVKEGYTFAGWYLNADFSGDRQEIPSVMPDKNVTYYAKWVAGAQVTLTLDVATGGTLAERIYTVAAGINLSNFLKNIVPTVENGLEFAGWFNGDRAISDGDTMPNRNLTLKAKYYANYTLSVYEQALDGSYPSSAQNTTGKAFYGESFSYETDKEHFHIDTDRDNKLSSANLGKNETFTVYLARNSYAVYYFNSASSSDYAFEEVLYGNTVEIVGSIFYVDGLRFAAWTQTPDEANANGVYLLEGDELTVDRDYYLYAQWDVAYYDMFGGSDYVFIPRFEDGVAILDRIGIGEKQGSYDKTTNVFSFEDEDGNTLLVGKIVGDAFYYYRDSVENVYADYDKSSATLEMKANGVAVYTDEQNVKTTGAYDVNEEGFYLFVSDTLNFVYRLESNSDSSEVKFRKQGAEAGYYLPATFEKEDGVELYYLNGFGEGLELYSASNPYHNNDITLTEIPLIYYAIDQCDNFVTYRLYSVILASDSFAHMFDFRIQSGSTVVNGQQTNGSMLRGDGFTGDYYPNNIGDNSHEGQKLRLDGFGKGTYGDKSITYVAHTENFFVYDPADDNIILINDFWVSFKVDGETTEYKIRPRSYDEHEGFYYDWIEGELFGLYEFENGYEEDGKTYNAIIYVFAGYSEATQLENYAILLIQIDKYEDYPLWLLFDFHYGLPLKADESGIYTMSEYGTKFLINSNKNAEFAQEKQVEIEFFNDERGSLVINEDGEAIYTPASGQAQKVTVEKGYGYKTYVVYIFDIDGTQYVFVCLDDQGAPIVYEATMLIQDSSQVDESVRIVLYNEANGIYSAVIGFNVNGTYYYAIEGTVEEQSNGHRFEYSDYDSDLEFPDYYLQFDYTQQNGVFTVVANELVMRSDDGDTLVFDGLGNAKVTYANGDTAEYEYVEYFVYNDNVVLYSLIRDRYFWLIIVNEEEKTFKFAEDEAGRYNNGVEKAQFDAGKESIYHYVLFDGEGVAYYVETDGRDETCYVGTYVKVGSVTVSWQEWEEYVVTIDYQSGQTLSLNIISSLFSQMYLAKDPSQEADYDVVGGGSLYGNGYGFYDELGQFASLATYVDADGITNVGILKVGVYNDNEYNKREFTAATTNNERKAVLFTVFGQLSNGNYYPVADLIFDLVSFDGDTVAKIRNFQSGTYRLVDEGKATDATMYLDGHGQATIYGADGNVTGNGTYEMATDIDEYTYRYFGSDNQTTFQFKLYMTEEEDGYAYEYAVYKPEHKGEFTSDEWAYLNLDGYLYAIYVDKYGVIYTGRYEFASDNVIVLYCDDGSDVLRFELLADNTFRIAQ